MGDRSMTPERPFGPVERATVSEQVRDDIHRRIISGEIPPGSPLPAERVLAEQFAVARTSVREAIQGMVALGVIERRGNRSYVAERLPDSEIAHPDGSKRSLREVLEARDVLETILFEMASQRATMRERTEALALARRPAPTGLGDFMIADRQFHAAVAGTCDNPVLVEVYGRVLDALMGTEEAASLVLGVEPDDDPTEAIARAAADHLRIAEAFAARDTELMLQEVARHHGPAVWRRVGRVRRSSGPQR
ncbi:MAG: GntR family transcriptional regulator, partial [Acidimicrobiia bacterium]|nr:GntR family transcriptional regulator [Acidimicrobiia bacterium]